MNNLLSWICSGVTLLAAAVSTSEVLQIILFIVGIVSAIISLAYNIFVWYKKAKADGKIDKKELEELGEIINKGVDDISKGGK